MDFLIVTGMSGAGKSQVSHALEDIGFFCIDNIPSELLERFFELCIRSDRKGRYAAVVDVRSHALFGDLPRLKKRMSELGAPLRVLYLDAADEVLCRRYKETRRRHPLMDGDSPQLSVPQAVEQERARMIDARAVADVVLDTSQTSAAQLKERIVAMFSAAPSGGMTVSVMSFGFKYGIPGDADLVFDVR
ncbi:MAG: RNase adapter RapZ, partial [Oscillospiraceae bacterium]